MGRRLKREGEVENSTVEKADNERKKIRTAVKKEREKPKKTVAQSGIKDNTSSSKKRSASKIVSTPETKKDMDLENEPKQKKAKVVRKRVQIKGEKASENDSSSADSGILLETETDTKRMNNSTKVSKTEITHSSKQTDSSGIGDEDSSSESEWEEVEEQDLDDYKPEIPKEGVEITIDCPDLHLRKRKKKQFDEREWIRLYINRERKEVQLNIHKTHLLCLLAHGFYVNNILNSTTLKGIAFSLLPGEFVSMAEKKRIDKIDSDGIERIVKWFRNSFKFETDKKVFVDLYENIANYFGTQICLNSSEYNLIFIVFSRCLGFKTRYCVSFYPVTHKAQNLIKKPDSKKVEIKKELPGCSKEGNKVKVKKDSNNKEKGTVIQKTNKSAKTSQKNVAKSKSDATKNEKIPRPRRSAGKSYKISSEESGDDLRDKDFKLMDGEGSDEDFEKLKTAKRSDKNLEKSKATRKSTQNTQKQKSNRKILSESEPSSPEVLGFESSSVVCWAEVYSKPDKQWISIDCVNNIVNKPYDIEANAPKPVTYIVAYDNDSHVKDVTRRYCSEYMTSTIKLRADTEWWEETLEPFLPPNSKLDKEEEKNLESVLINKPLPTTVAGFKNHPLYALKRHLLKFEAIYPPDAAPVGFMRGEPVYARECVCQLHSRETWLKEARVVRIQEEPYKIVKARPKWDKMAGVMRTDLPLEVFGFWQTEPYEPPIAVDGKVPRNEYGNVELFKSCMLPRGTVHLRLAGLNRVAKKLGIDCSPAVVGFDGHKGSIHPVFDGFVVCEEYKDTIIAAWDEEQENARKRDEEKREKRIYGHWKKLIRGLLIRERIKIKYDVK